MYRSQTESDCGCRGNRRRKGQAEVKDHGNRNGGGNDSWNHSGSGSGNNSGRLWYSPGYKGIRKV